MYCVSVASGVGEGDVGGIGSVNQSLGGFICSLPVLVALEERWV